MHVSSSHGPITLRRFFLLTASLFIGTVIWFLLGDSDGLVAAEKPLPAGTLAATSSAAADEVLAHVDGVAITEAQVEAAVADRLAALDTERHLLLAGALESRIDEQLIESEAESRGLDREHLLALEVEDKLGQIDDAAVAARYRELGLERPLREVESEIRHDLRYQAFLAELRQSAAVAIYGEPAG